MKHCIKIGLAILSLLPAFAAQGADADALLSAFSKKLNGYKSVEIAFTFSNEKYTNQNYTGTALCSGNKFRLLTDEFEVYSDGSSKWLCNKESDEVIVQYVSNNEETRDITDNPLLFITTFQKGFSYKQKRVWTADNSDIKYVDIEFTPTAKNSTYASILVTLEEKTANPYAIKYTLKDGTSYTIRITRITPNPEVFDGYFTFPKHKYPTADIIDLR